MFCFCCRGAKEKQYLESHTHCKKLLSSSALLSWSVCLSQGKHSKDCQGSGGGHQDAGVWCSLWTGQAVTGRPVLCQDHHAADRRGQTGSRQHWLRRPGDAGEKLFRPSSLAYLFLIPCACYLFPWRDERGRRQPLPFSHPRGLVLNLQLSLCPLPQVVLINAVKDVAKALSELISATKCAAGKAADDPSMYQLKSAAKVRSSVGV